MMRVWFVAIAIAGLSGCFSAATRASSRAGTANDAAPGIDHDGIDHDGIDYDGIDRNGFDRDDFDPDGFDSDGFDRDGIHRDGSRRDALDGSRRDALDGSRREALERERAHAPPVAEVLGAAYAAAGLGPELPGHYAARARLGGLVPWVSVRTGRDTSWRDEDPDVGRGTTLEVRATWRLDRLVFDGRELQVVALEAARRRERRRLATHVIRTYFTWKRSGSRADEAAAELDSLTAGWFSEAKQRSASEVRTVSPLMATP